MPLKWLVSAVVMLAALVVLFLFLLATDTALSVWNYLQQAPAWLRWTYAILLLALPLVTAIGFWSWLRPSRKPGPAAPTAPADAESLQNDLLQAARQGVDISHALDEISEQRRRKSSGELYIAIHGEVSSGKSSLVKALLPQAEIDCDARAGTTQVITHYRWTAPSGDQVVIADLPGFNFDEETPALEETRRAHLVIFLCDGDLTASQARQLHQLRELGKPIVLALNKSDRYTADELEQLRHRLQQHSRLSAENVVTIQAGGREDVVRLLGEGIEERVSRQRPAEILPLLHAVQSLLDRDRELMESLRDTAVLMLANDKLLAARSRHRSQQADELVSRYARRAVVGALAAVAPGSDLVIQGVLATQLMRELSSLYDVPVKEMEIESFLRLAGGKVKNMTAITLAIAGNALKAFPGIGTLTGGMVHAVAYGMIFDSLGRAAAATLASRGELRPLPAAQAFEELLHENLESGAVRFAKMALTRNGQRET